MPFIKNFKNVNTGNSFFKHHRKFIDLKEYFEGHNGGSGYLAKKYGISKYTIDTWIRMRKKPELYHEGAKRGRKKDSEIDWKQRYEILKKFQAFLRARRERR